LLREKLRKILDRPSTSDLLDELEHLLNKMIEDYKPISVIITGSLANSKFIRGMSDIDILIVVERSPDKYNRFLLKAVKDVNVEISIYSMDEVVQSILSGNQFIVEAIDKGIEVYGHAKEKLKRIKLYGG